jgi:hypothetical protein
VRYRTDQPDVVLDNFRQQGIRLAAAFNEIHLGRCRLTTRYDRPDNDLQARGPWIPASLHRHPALRFDHLHT